MNEIARRNQSREERSSSDSRGSPAPNTARAMSPTTSSAARVAKRKGRRQVPGRRHGGSRNFQTRGGKPALGKSKRAAGKTPLAVQKHLAKMTASQDAQGRQSRDHAIRARASARQHRTDALRRQLEEAEARELTLKPAITDYYKKHPNVVKARGKTALERFEYDAAVRKQHLQEIKSEVNTEIEQKCTFQPEIVTATPERRRRMVRRGRGTSGRRGTERPHDARNSPAGGDNRPNASTNNSNSPEVRSDENSNTPFWDRLYKPDASAVGAEASRQAKQAKPGWRGSGSVAPELRKNPFSPARTSEEEKRRRKTFYAQIKKQREKLDTQHAESAGSAKGSKEKGGSLPASKSPARNKLLKWRSAKEEERKRRHHFSNQHQNRKLISTRLRRFVLRQSACLPCPLI